MKPGLERNPMFLTFVFGAALRMFTFKKTSARELDHIWRSVYLSAILMVTRGGSFTILPQSELSSLNELNLMRGTFQVSNTILSLQHRLNPFHKQCILLYRIQGEMTTQIHEKRIQSRKIELYLQNFLNCSQKLLSH
jgi:hypothetical protein